MTLTRNLLCSAAAFAFMGGLAQAATVVVTTDPGTSFQSPTGVRADTGSRGVDLTGAIVTATYADATSESITWQNIDLYTPGKARGANFALFSDYRGFDLQADLVLASLSIDLSTSNSIVDGSGRSVFDALAAPAGEPGNTPSSSFGIPVRFDGQSYVIESFFGQSLSGTNIVSPNGTVNATYANGVGIGATQPQGDLFSTLTLDFTALVGGGFLGQTNFQADVDTLTSVAAVPLPAGLPLLLAGLAGLGVIRRRAAAP